MEEDIALSLEDKPPDLPDRRWNGSSFGTKNIPSQRFKPTPKKAIKSDSPPSFTINPLTLEFKNRFYPEVSPAQWSDWHWQLCNRITTLHQLEKFITLSSEEKESLSRRTETIPLSITPYYASLLENTCVRKSVVPTGHEFVHSPEERGDPLGEDHHTPVPGLVHRYPDRVLFLATGFCFVYCRYCTRSRMVGDKVSWDKERWEKAISYIENNPVIRDVLISGGDPLTLSDDRLEWLLSQLRRIPHVEIIRIGSKAPVVMPQRITRNLVKMLKKYHPLWMSIHFTHPAELTEEVQLACSRLADAGIPLGSQTVLLRGINDSVLIMKELFHKLLKIRVRPYYMYQCDLIPGSGHFRTPVEKGLEIIRGLRGHTSGYAIPTYVIDAPGGGGKIPLLPDYILGREGDRLLLTNYTGGKYHYPDAGGTTGLMENYYKLYNI